MQRPNLVSLLDGRAALLRPELRDERLDGRHLYVNESFVTTGIRRPDTSVVAGIPPRTFEKDWFRAEFPDKWGRTEMVDLRGMPSEFAGTTNAIATFVSELPVITEREIRLTPKPGTLQVSRNPPKNAGKCLVNEDATFEEVPKGVDTKTLNPERVGYLWVPEMAVVGGVILYSEYPKNSIGTYYGLGMPAYTLMYPDVPRQVG